MGSGLDPAESVIAKIKNNLSICAGLIAAADRDKAPPAPSPSGQTAATNAQSNKTQCPDLTGPGLLLTGQGNLNSAAAGGCQAANAPSPTPPPPSTGQPSPAGAPTKPTAQTNQTAEATPSPTPQQPAAPIGEAESSPKCSDLLRRIQGSRATRKLEQTLACKPIAWTENDLPILDPDLYSNIESAKQACAGSAPLRTALEAAEQHVKDILNCPKDPLTYIRVYFSNGYYHLVNDCKTRSIHIWYRPDESLDHEYEDDVLPGGGFDVSDKKPQVRKASACEQCVCPAGDPQ